MFKKKNAIEYCIEISDIDALRDYVEFAYRKEYQCKVTVEHAAGKPYYVVTIGLNRYEADQLALDALSNAVIDFHIGRKEERNAKLEDARSEGYAKAVKDNLNRKD